jgi:hypothetical protein
MIISWKSKKIIINCKYEEQIKDKIKDWKMICLMGMKMSKSVKKILSIKESL